MVGEGLGQLGTVGDVQGSMSPSDGSLAVGGGEVEGAGLPPCTVQPQAWADAHLPEWGSTGSVHTKLTEGHSSSCLSSTVPVFWSMANTDKLFES